MGIKIDIVESGSTINSAKMLGMVPESHEPADFNLYVRQQPGSIRVTRSDTDEVIVKAQSFDKAMVALADHYNLTVEVAADPGVKVTAKMGDWIGRYEPTEILTTRTLVTRDKVAVGDLVTWQTVVGEDDPEMVVAEITAITRHSLVLKDVSNRLRFKLGGGHYDSPEGLSAEYWHGRVTVKYTPAEIASDVTGVASAVSDWRNGPRVIEYPTTGEAYDASQSDESIKDGTIFIIRTERVVGMLMGAWPVAVTPERGEFHRINQASYVADYMDGRYVPAWDHAVKLAEAMGFMGAQTAEAVISDVAWDGAESAIWRGTGTLIKPVRTKLAKRARKSARRARRGCKGGM